MKTSKVLLIMLAIVASSCNKEELPITGSVSGEFTLSDPSTPLVRQPAKDVKLYLIDHEIISDTKKHKSYRDVIVDSATTNNTGKYLMDMILWGSNSLIIVPEGTRYRFEPVYLVLANFHTAAYNFGYGRLAGFTVRCVKD